MSTEKYDSKADTFEHIWRVGTYIRQIVADLLIRASVHDASKLKDPEKPLFDEMTPLLKTLVYGTPEYQGSLLRLGPALTHHYAHNRHHPEHFEDGVDGMTLVDLVEMYCDWVAATRRTKGGSMKDSIEKNKARFKLSPQLVNIFENTVEFFGHETEPVA